MTFESKPVTENPEFEFPIEEFRQLIEQNYNYSQVAHEVADLIDQGNLRLAKNTCFNQSDKFGGDGRNKLKDFLFHNLFAGGKNNPWSLTYFDIEGNPKTLD
jgi:hypothetical protein